MENVNRKLFTAISKNLPPGKELIQYLTELLDLNRKSALRKVRGESPLSIKEVSLISSELNISLDDIIGQYKKDRIYFDLNPALFPDPENTFINMVRQNNEILKRISQAENKQTIFCLNGIFFTLFMRYKNLFNFLYYKYIQRTKPGSLYLKMSELAIPPELDKLRNERLEMADTFGDITCIIDDDIVHRATKDILYYYERNLIAEEEFLLLKEELFQILDKSMTYLQSGISNYNKNISIYYSMSDIKSNCTYYKFDQNIYSQFWFHMVYPITISDPDTCAFQKKWLESLKKRSILITQTNEIAQSEFIIKQRRAIENMVIKNT